jgi:mono/diheme cytochrome c family protein
MKSIKLALVVTTIALFAFACSNASNTNQTSGANTAPGSPSASPSAKAQASPTPADEFAQIRPTYAEGCTVCHGPKGDGGTVTIQGKKLKVPSLKEGHALNHTEEQLAKQIAQGGDGMPAFKDRLTPEQINELVRLIRKEFQGKTGAAPGK